MLVAWYQNYTVRYVDVTCEVSVDSIKQYTSTVMVHGDPPSAQQLHHMGSSSERVLR